MRTEKYISPSKKFKELTYGLSSTILTSSNEGVKIGGHEVSIILNTPTDLTGVFEHKQKVKLKITSDGQILTIYGVTRKTKGTTLAIRLTDSSYSSITLDTFYVNEVYTSPFFRFGDLKNGNIELNQNYNEFPLIYMLSPNEIQQGDDDSPFFYEKTDFTFIICDRYKAIDANSNYDSFTERLLNDVVEGTGEIMLSFERLIKDSGIFLDPTFSFNEQIPVGVSLRDNQSGKTAKVFSQNLAGQLVTVSCGFDREYNCDESQTARGWDDELFWNDNDVWKD